MPAQLIPSNTIPSNIRLLEHVNLTQPDQRLATLFYVVGLGLTRDPYMMVARRCICRPALRSGWRGASILCCRIWRLSNAR